MSVAPTRTMPASTSRTIVRYNGLVASPKALERPSAVSFDGVKVFSATMVADRQILGEKVTDWIRAHPRNEIVDVVVTQSSDAQFHCIAMTVFFREHRG